MIAKDTTMPKANKHGSQQPESNANAANAAKTANTTDTNKASTSADNALQTQKKTTASTPSSSSRNKQSSKNTSSRVGGTAVQSAKSMQPKQITSNDPQQQQTESYNRQMRRRMEHLGTSPSQNAGMERNRKRMEKRRRRIEERRQEVKKVAASGPRDIRVGHNVVYFLIAVAVIIVVLIVLAIVINHPF
jgi:cobalamin biosynthesis Mg chelatase CobN